MKHSAPRHANRHDRGNCIPLPWTTVGIAGLALISTISMFGDDGIVEQIPNPPYTETVPVEPLPVPVPPEDITELPPASVGQ